MLVRAPLGFAVGGPLGLNAVRYETVPQAMLNDRKGFQPRGKALGASSAVNAMLYCRANPKDYDAWAAAGNPGWDHASVLPYLRKAEHNECIGENAWRGTEGPLSVGWLRRSRRRAASDVAPHALTSRRISRAPT